LRNPENCAWQTPCVLAVLETDTSELIGRIAEARKAIENRLFQPIQIDSPEHLAIKEAWKGLATLESERVSS
jgi:hypothetical protein